MNEVLRPRETEIVIVIDQRMKRSVRAVIKRAGDTWSGEEITMVRSTGGPSYIISGASSFPSLFSPSSSLDL